MAELLTSRNWLMQGMFLVLCLLIVFFHLLPLTTLPARWPTPDLIICLAFAWGMRRPDYVPVLLLAGVMLVADLLCTFEPVAVEERAGQPGPGGEPTVVVRTGFADRSVAQAAATVSATHRAAAVRRSCISGLAACMKRKTSCHCLLR